MSCGTGECGCEDFVELKTKKSLPVVEETRECGDGSCGCGCVDVSAEKARSAEEK